MQAKTEAAAEKLLADAKCLEDAGAFAVVLECIPRQLARHVTQSLTIPTIGIGAGKECDGQVLVLYDMLGLFSDYVPSFVKKYAELNTDVTSAVKTYIQEVKEEVFPI